MNTLINLFFNSATMKKTILLSIVLSSFMLSINAQVKIKDGTIASADAPMSSAVLEIESSNKGLLLPRVALTATNVASPLSSAMGVLAGMTVYNTATSGSGDTGVTPGVYYNDGSKWVRAAGGGSSTSAMPWFYMPSIAIPVSYTTESDRSKTINLYEEYKRQMNTSGTNSRIVSSDNSQPSVLSSVPTADRFIYYVTDYDPNLFETVAVSPSGVLTYKIKTGAVATSESYMNIVFVAK